MIKRITLVLLLCFITATCGKKGDPEYKDLEKKTKLQTISKNKV